MTGMPILYYKANRMKVENDKTKWNDSTYNLRDNFCSGQGFINAPAPFGGEHPLKNQPTNAGLFYDKIQNPNFPGPPARPYRAESFLLQSAGEDGLYGTMDDVFNFDQDN